MKPEWKHPETNPAPLGVPLIVTIKCNWKDLPEVLGPVYRLKNGINGGTEYVNFGAGAKIGTVENSVIGPNGVAIWAWDYWPAAMTWRDNYVSEE